ncbi:SDR family oxidoreductase [Sulfuricystis multivorans]|uniref:SDR family oxidoreductase n=1 Tax=Sulfuricystis multivorans TaxID=2211108 RepID=UPI000F838977|nr:SDR family oxidoreductase [Sulfuricystis multivorans]
MKDISTILVTGATGNIGRALVEILQTTPSSLSTIAASPSGQSVAGAPGRPLNLLNTASTRAAMQGIERLFLLTPAHPEMEAMTANAVRAAQAAGVQHIVRVSGAGADPKSEIAIARLQGSCDQIVIDSGIAYTLLRPKNFMQNFTTFLRDMIRSGAVYSSQGEGRVPFIDARDIAAVAAQVLRDPQAHASQVYTLTGPQALTNAEALAVIAEHIGRPIQLVSISEEQAVEGMRQAGMPEPLVQAMSSLNRIIAAGWVAEVTDDVPRLLGRPATAWADFVAEHRHVWQ